MFDKLQLDIIERALGVLISNYDEYDLEKLGYTGEELETEIHTIYDTMEQWA
tara:strand:- start:36 stop:191 length:156 start_codon:yes stop_codon:yes gene_type:complete